MKPVPAVALAALALLALAAAPEVPGPQSLVDGEHAFAAAVAARGIRAGFLEWLAPKAVVFRPGPVNGPAAYSEAKASAARLAWRPEYAAISSAGDLGWTSGPWSWRRDSASAEAAWGDYLSLWKRGADGRLRVVLDVGVSHARRAPLEAPAFLAPADAPAAARGPLDRRRSLWKADADFGALARQGGVATALEQYGHERVVLLREGRGRVVGLSAACDSARAHEGSATLMSLAQFLSGSGDLGYTYGTFLTGSVEAPDSAWYVHVWHRGRAKPWELAVELVAPVPKAR